MVRLYGLASLVLLTSVAAVVAQEFPKPGPEHEMLRQNAGTWTAVCKMAGGEESKGEMTSKSECGGLWLVSNFEGEFGGQKFQGKGLDTFDAEKKKFISVWVDSMTTTPMILEGTYDEKAKTLTMLGEGKGPDGQPAKHKLVTKYTDKDHQTMEMFLVGADGKDLSMMTIEYTRKK